MFKHGRTNKITTIILLIATYILNIIDYLQTKHGINMLGISIELNPVGRFCFEHNCAFVVKFVGVLIILILISLVIIKIEPRFIFTLYFLFIFFLAVVTHNFIQLNCAGILNF